MIIATLLLLCLSLDIIVAAKLYSAFRLLRFPSLESIDDLPSVTICITARNETHAMTQCLERVVATDYKKLEVIVLDDGSRDDTSLLIKSFAHAGVRFVEGKPLPDGWLGKNYAQSILANEASGKYVFFMDVDTLIDRYTVSRLVGYMMAKSATMVSVIPIRNDHWQTSTLFATMRHFWTVMRFRTHKPRAAANAWIIERDYLIKELANDASLQQSVQMETTLARQLAGDGCYRLIMSNQWLGLRYEKKWDSQVETSIRLLYPQCDKHWYQVLGLAFVLMLAIVPYMLALFSPIACGLIGLQFLIALYYLAHVWARYRVIGAILLPVTIIQEIILLFVSAYRYNFGTITWKGRPIGNRT